MIRCCIALLLSLVLLPAHSATLLVLGDSISAGYGIDAGKGWVELMRDQLGEEHQVINASISGETTDGGLRRLPCGSA